MNRRSFLKGIIGAGVALSVPELILPEKRIWALGGLTNGMQIVPSRLTGDDTAFVQWHIDHNEPIPYGAYDINAPLMVRDKTNQIVDGSGTVIRVHGNHDGLLMGENLQDTTISNFTMHAVDHVKYAMYFPV